MTMAKRWETCPKCDEEESLYFKGGGEYMDFIQEQQLCGCYFTKDEIKTLEEKVTLEVREDMAQADAEAMADFYDQWGDED